MLTIQLRKVVKRSFLRIVCRRMLLPLSIEEISVADKQEYDQREDT